MELNSPGFWGQHTLIYASSPQTFSTTFGELHVWEFVGILLILSVVGVIAAELLVEPWSANSRSASSKSFSSNNQQAATDKVHLRELFYLLLYLKENIISCSKLFPLHI